MVAFLILAAGRETDIQHIRLHSQGLNEAQYRMPSARLEGETAVF